MCFKWIKTIFRKSDQIQRDHIDQVQNDQDQNKNEYYFENVLNTLHHTSPLRELKYYNFANKTIRHIWKLDLKWPDGKKYNPDNIYFTNPNVKEYKPTMCDYGFICDVLDYIEENNYDISNRILMYEKGNGDNINCVGGTYGTSINNIKTSIFARRSRGNIYLLVNIYNKVPDNYLKNEMKIRHIN
jgi:hypothetical protein